MCIMISFCVTTFGFSQLGGGQVTAFLSYEESIVLTVLPCIFLMDFTLTPKHCRQNHVLPVNVQS